MYSAPWLVNGQKLYDLARQGKTVERKARAITVYELELLEQSAPDEFTLRVVCLQWGPTSARSATISGRRSAAVGVWRRCGRTMAAGFRL